jgi:exonuclease SbcC
MLEKFFKSDAEQKSADSQQQKELDAQKALEIEMRQLAELEDQTRLAELAIRSSYTKVRQGAAEKISDAHLLHDIEKNSQDKSVQHIVREKTKQQKQAVAEQQQAQQHIDDICHKLEQLAKSSHSPLFKQQYQHLLREWTEHNSALHQAAKTAQQSRFSQAQKANEAVLAEFAEEETRLQMLREAELTLAAEREAEKIISAASSKEEQEKQEQATLLKQQQNEQKETQKKQRDKEQNLLEQGLKGILSAIELALQEGHVNHAAKKLKNAQNKLEALDKKIAQHYENKLQLLHKQLVELRDWQGFAALPKKQELCEKMQQLAEIELPPQALADAIHDLQEQWRELKGGSQQEEQKLWLQFKEAADKAYEPCKQYFNQQRELRAENFRQRENICTELENYYQAYHWEQADWKAVEKITETAKNEFHRFAPVDHKKQAVIKERFDKALKPIIEKLRGEQKNHEGHKQQLIEQAKKLLESTDVRAAIEEAKKLQQQWKTAGITRPREDQKLWQQFRTVCDQIFAKRNAEKEQLLETVQQDIAKAEDFCKQIEALSALNDVELQQSRDQYQALRNQFLSLATLSKEKQQKLFRHFYKICDHYQERIAGIKDRKQRGVIDESFRKARLCEQLESGVAADSITSQWASDITLHAEHEAVLNKRYTQAQKIARAEASVDFAANEKQRRLILIQLEILHNRETPAQDKALRMDYQLKQLSGGLGKKVTDVKQQANALLLEWLGCGVGLTEYREQLQQRFDSLVK